MGNKSADFSTESLTTNMSSAANGDGRGKEERDGQSSALMNGGDSFDTERDDRSGAAYDRCG
jgi:hypothetical protein